MVVTEDEINDYLLKVKDAIKKDKYKLERNRNRVDNNNLFIDYRMNIKVMSTNFYMSLAKTLNFWKDWAVLVG